MTENQTDTKNGGYTAARGTLEKIENTLREKYGGEALPDSAAYEEAMRARNDEWRPDTRKISRAELRRRRMADDLAMADAGVIGIDILSIVPNRSQPRTVFESNSVLRLADSIKRYGILQPLTVRLIPTAESDKNGFSSPGFEIIAGERRYRAAKMLGMASVPCIIVEADDKKSAELALIENLLREDLNIFETARGLRKLIENFRLTQEEVAKRLSMSQSAVANKLRLLRLSPEEETFVLENGLTERHARALLKITDAEERKKAMQTVVKAKMNVSATESYIDRLLSVENTDEEAHAEKKFIPIIKDVRLFYNSLDRAVETVRSAGVEISSSRKEENGAVKIEINIPFPRGKLAG